MRSSVDRLAEPVGQFEPAGGGGSQGEVEDLDARPAPLLGPVHGHVGVAEQGLGGHLVGVVPAIPMLALTTRSRPSTTAIGRARPFADALRRLDRLADGHPRQHDHELVAGQAPDRAERLHQVADPRRDRPQDPVAGLVAVGVVDRLEPVEIDEQDGDGPAFGQAVVEHLEHPGPVGQSGQAVVGGGVGQAVHPGPPLGDVGDRADDGRRATVGPAVQGLAAHRQPAPALIPVDADDLVAGRGAGRQCPADRILPGRDGPAEVVDQVLGVGHGQDVGPLGDVRSEQGARRRVERADGAVVLGDHDPFAERGDDGGEAALGLLAGRRRQHPFGLVGADRHLAALLAHLVAQRGDGHPHGDQAPVGPAVLDQSGRGRGCRRWRRRRGRRTPAGRGRRVG